MSFEKMPLDKMSFEDLAFDNLPNIIITFLVIEKKNCYDNTYPVLSFDHHIFKTEITQCNCRTQIFEGNSTVYKGAMTLSIMTLTKMTFNITTLSITIKIRDTQHNST
jgi:hypothetical protein